MQRMWRIVICMIVVCFGLIELGGFGVHKGEAVNDQEIIQARAAAAVTNYEAMPHLTAQASYDTEKQLEQGKSAASAAVPKNDRVQADSLVSNQKLLYLTFDDGPSKNTDQVLDILKREGITATFFVLGEQVLKQPELVKRIVKEGHAIGNHTFDHKYKRLYGSFAEFADQVMKTDEAIYRTTGVRTTLVRAPGGTYSNFDQGYFDAMKAAGYQVHDWNVDSGDSKRQGVPASEILTTIKGSKIASKLNVLLHDSAGHAESVKALPSIIKYYKEKGYTFAKLTDQVEPIQFKVASKLKWNRKQVTKQQVTELTLFSEKLSQSSLSVQTEKQVPTLILHRGEKSLVLESSEYGIKNGFIVVSLQKLTEWIEDSIELELNQEVIEEDASAIRELPKSGKEDQSINERKDQILVPVRETLQKFGIAITKYVYNETEREIWVTE
ncbi:polysaccharide deacetylase family protein [Bacillus sp. FJAT-28004]|uniref:polysaccharide deacetylase family protein n=1 Tax=Bacillus sp. FJAT-28004 TaxID=1679165 RepID=UPI0006B55889|nr:polysaccharide deacetylase family protein [Bacillus sp. FJAT-28004]